VGQQPARPFAVVVIPTAIRDSMSAIWTHTNRGWDDASGGSVFAPAPIREKPSRAYFGCLAGKADGDTLRVYHLAPATGLRRRQNSVTGDCSTVPDHIGTWHTHLYRAGYQGHLIKERGLSGFDFRTFAGSAYLITIAMWDADSLALATKGPDGRVESNVRCIIR
jgi:hypothetical protein